MSVSSLYTVELVFHIVTMAIMWPIYFSQFLSFRFTPRRKFNDTKLYLILLGLLAMMVQTVRTVDPSSAFDRLDLPTQRALYAQLGAVLMYAVILVVCGTARTLCVQLSRPLPKWFIRAVWGINIANHITTVPVSISNGVYYPSRNEDALMITFMLQVIIFSVSSLSTLVVYWFLFVNLRRRIREFLVTLTRQEEMKKKSAEQLRSQLPAAGTMQTKDGTNNNDEQVPLYSTKQNSSKGSKGSKRGPLRIAVAEAPADPPPPTTTAIDGEGTAGADGGERDIEAAIQPASPSYQPQVPADLPSPIDQSGPANKYALLPQTNNSPVASVRTAPTNAAVAPAGGSPPPIATRSLTRPTVTQSDTRLLDLESAIKKMNILTALLTFLLIGTLASHFSNWIAFFSGKVISDVIHPPYQTGGSYRMGGAIQTVVNQVGLAAILWYAWTSPRVWWSSGLPFWSTIRYGAKDDPLDGMRAAPFGAQREITKSSGGQKAEVFSSNGRAPDASCVATPKHIEAASPSAPPRVAHTIGTIGEESPASPKAAW